MSKVLKNGCLHGIFKETCKVCGCEFEAIGPEDFHIIRKGSTDIGPVAQIVVYCPECKQDVIHRSWFPIESY